MAAAIGAVGCTFVKGQPRDLKMAVQSWTVPGLDGYGAQTIGKRGSEFRFLCVKYGSEAAVDTWIAALEALQGTVQTIVNDWGSSYANMLITHVGQPAKVAAIGDFTGSPGARAAIMVAGVKIPTVA